MKIFVTGASSGLGFALTKLFLKRGDKVWGIGRRELKLDLKENFKYYQCDITRREAIEKTFEDMVKADFIPDIVVFCAGSATEDILKEGFSTERFKENFRVNLFGILYWIELLLPYFLKRNSGVFAAISSMSIYLENHGQRIGYSASRIALNKAFENLHLEYMETGMHFKIFNMGRMKEDKGLVGITYIKAAEKIIRRLESGKYSNTFNIPYSQFVMTKVASFIPERIFGIFRRKSP